jgi:mono/diheme cytochrome c family protein
LYPPTAEAPILLQEMFALGGALTGIAVDLSENDVEQIDAQFEKFRTQYAAASRLVPEWEEDYPTGPVDRLGDALQTGDPEQVMVAFGAVAKVCHDCHVVNMPKVQQKYHWGDFAQIRVANPVSDEELGFKELMQGLETSFVGIEVDLEQRQVENARTQFEAFNRTFQLLKQTCAVCHDTQRKYFVDPAVQGMLERLATALRNASPDPEVVGELRLGIGTESCVKCHLVHGPAALAKQRWEAWENVEGR